MSVLRKFLKLLGIAGVFIGFLLVVLTAPIDDTPLADQPFYQAMQRRMDSITIPLHHPTQPVRVGWSQLSIVPDHPLQMAGYKPRPTFTDVHDSLYVKVMAVDNGAYRIYFVSVDLLLFPPALRTAIEEKLPKSDSDFVYYTATHTHTAVGGWDPSLLGSILMGEYDSSYIHYASNQVISAIERARASADWATVRYWERSAPENIYNRIDTLSPVDDKFRGLIIERADGQQALLFAVGAHPTSISKKFTALSADYPGAMARELNEYKHVQFMAGAIGSQSFKGFGRAFEWELVDSVGRTFSRYVRFPQNTVSLPSDLDIQAAKVQLFFGKSQLRLTKNLKLRDWIFKSINHPLAGEITVVRIGNVLLLGTPCDFAGEIAVVNGLVQYANDHGLKLIITSFNGQYTGYVTADHHYFNSDYEEVRILNWVGPYFGEYYSQLIKKIIDKTAIN